MDLRLRTRLGAGQSERATVVEVAGELDLHSAPRLRAEVARAIESHALPRIVIDLGGVTFLDSTGVGVLVGALKRAREADGQLHFCSPQPRVCRVFEITGLVGVLPLFSTREEAASAFGPELDLPVASATPQGATPQGATPQGATLLMGETQ